MLVYRVEMKCGKGPYHARKSNGNVYSYHVDLCNDHNRNMDRWPSAGTDCGSFFDSDYVCGFDSMEALKEWFGDYLPRILKSGGKIKEFVVDQRHIKFGKSGLQLMFDKTRAVPAESVMCEA